MTDNPSGFDFFHVSRKQFRADIEKEGLKAQTVTNGLDERDEGFESKGPGVWVAEQPETDYGTDIYGIKNPPTGETRKWYGGETPVGKHETEVDDHGHEFVPHDVPISDFKRVGHVYNNPSGHAEVHWHPEEECRG